jgi:hypothetical protein
MRVHLTSVLRNASAGYKPVRFEFLRASRITSVLLFSTILVATSFGADEWRQKSRMYSEANVVERPVNVPNLGTVPITVAANSGYIGHIQWIVGASQSGPPTWDAKFNPLGQADVYASWSHPAITINPNYTLRVEVSWVNSFGNQQFEWYSNGVASGILLRRDRDWWDWVSSVYFVVPPPGSEGGGN